jgi:hypothetical protein
MATQAWSWHPLYLSPKSSTVVQGLGKGASEGGVGFTYLPGLQKTWKRI